MNRKTFLTLTPLALLAGLFVKVPRAQAAGETLHFQQDPPTHQWRDAITGNLGTSGSTAPIDFSTFGAGAKFVNGFLSLEDFTPGTGEWKVEVRPPLLGGLGWTSIFQGHRNLHDINVPIWMRCDNSQFEIRVTRPGSLSIGWAFGPVAWWS